MKSVHFLQKILGGLFFKTLLIGLYSLSNEMWDTPGFSNGKQILAGSLYGWEGGSFGGSLPLQAGSLGLQPQSGINGRGGHTCNPSTS